MNKFHRNWYKLQSLIYKTNKLNISALFKENNTDAFNIIRGTTNSLDDALILRANNRNYLSKGIQIVLNKSYTRKRQNTILLLAQEYIMMKWIGFNGKTSIKWKRKS